MSHKGGRRLRILLISLAVFGLTWYLSPWLYLSGVRVEVAQLVSTPRGSTVRPRQLTTPDWIVVRFTTGQDLARFRSRWRLPFIQAEISACRTAAAGINEQVATQGSDYFADNGRVRALGKVDERHGVRYAYEAVFDNRLDSVGEDHRLHSVRASTVPGGVCFRLHGAMPVSGSVRSATVPLILTRR